MRCKVFNWLVHIVSWYAVHCLSIDGKKDEYLHWEVGDSQAHQDTCAKLKEKYKEKHKEVEGTVTPESKEIKHICVHSKHVQTNTSECTVNLEQQTNNKLCELNLDTDVLIWGKTKGKVILQVKEMFKTQQSLGKQLSATCHRNFSVERQSQTPSEPYKMFGLWRILV